MTLFRLQSHLKSLSWPSPITTLRTFNSSLAMDSEESSATTALGDIPYLDHIPDPSIFEHRSNEYDRVLLPDSPIGMASSSRAPYGHYASALLERLLRRGMFAEAEEVRQELVATNVRIRPSKLYFGAAQHVLRRRPWPPNRTESFANWLSLVPTMDKNPKEISFTGLTSSLLFSSNRLDLESVAQFGIILSSKGYIRKVGSAVVAYLTRYAHPDVSLRVLNELIAADDDYKHNVLGLTYDTRRTDTTKRLWSIAVRVHCTAGRSEMALQMARRAHEDGCHLTRYTYQYLLGKLNADNLKEYAEEVRALPGCQSLDEASSHEPIPPISPGQSRAVNHARAIALLKRCSLLGLPVYAADIVPYFDLYKTDLRGDKMVVQLRASAYRHSLPAVSSVLLAELLHHHRRGQFTHVLWVFEKFFHVVGVPREFIKRRLWARDHYPAQMQIHDLIPAHITKTTFNLPSGLWPTSYHTALVWSALVHLCESEDELLTLYDLLLRLSAQPPELNAGSEHQTPSPDGGASDGESLTPVTGRALEEQYDAAHFLPFLIVFTHNRGALRGLRVLDDMEDRGITTSPQILSVAAALQARYGEPALALRMLDAVGEREEREEREDQGGAGAAEAAKMREQRYRQLLLIAHTGVLRSLLDRRSIVPARQVAKWLRERVGYTEEGGDGADGARNVRTDIALRFLRRLETEGLRAEPELLPDVIDVWGQHREHYPFLKPRNHEIIKTRNAVPGVN
ncbi:hypothetical protein F5148DRAFT_1189044 [Russula earlei]|uniref:Uncharacterized protein n=1 Tax=Russula earlei TaxID=71964 RepID=A0ACC0UCP6_9AGAM|nr:hypothetical protein F5148DRAFT_1189044 [Russula earlei]